MKTLTKLLLIHWHYFKRELIEFDRLNFLTGMNASGKSTIIDAMQLILLGDTGGSFFNNAASGRGSKNRTLKSYLKGELGDDENSGFRYLREGRFTSYIAMEFYDDEKDKLFTIGCCFDVYSGDEDIKRMFFLYDGGMHPQEFLDSAKVPMDITALRAFLKNDSNGRFETTEVCRDFRGKLYGKLGGLRERFAELLKKAVSFNPDVKIQEFISEFVCDNQQPVDISHMQENIRSYKRLEEEAAVLQEKIALLCQINKMHDDYVGAAESEKLYTFLIDRAEADKVAEELVAEKLNARKLAEQLEALTNSIDNNERRLSELRKQRETLHVELSGSSAMLALERIDRQMSEKRQCIDTLQREHERTRNSLAASIAAWRDGAGTLLRKIKLSNVNLNINLQHAGIASRAADICEECVRLLEQLPDHANMDAADILRIGENGIVEIFDNANDLKTHAVELASRLRDEQDAVSKQRAELMTELQSLESGIYRFPQDALDLKDALVSRLRTIAKCDVDVRIVAEGADIKNDRWRNAIEGYLHTQKFYIIVPQEYFMDALRVFDAIKREKAVYGTGIVDIEKIKKQNPTITPGSLAEEIETTDADIKLFLDFILGGVKKCDDVKELRHFKTSITDEGMLYQNFVVRAMNPKRFAKPAIGQGAIKRRLNDVKNEIAALTDQISVCASVLNGLSAANKLSALTGEDIKHIVQSAKNMDAVPELTADLDALQKDRDAVDTTAIHILTSRIAALDADIGALDRKLKEDTEIRGKKRGESERLLNSTIPKLERDSQEREATAAQHGDEWITAKGMPRYTRELSARGKPDQIISAFGREQSKARNSKTAAQEELFELRRNYNDKYKMGLYYKEENNDEYYKIWADLSSNELPNFTVKISDAKSKAFEQFQEDFISRLQNNINNARQQINDLNDALKGASFGEDTYRFQIIPNPEYKRFYDMILDEMITHGGYNIFSSQFNDKYKDEIADLFKIVTNEGGGGGISECERRVVEFTDFRNYLTFDLEVTGKDGESQRLSKTLGKKSGGETQTPFYIAVLASFAQLYREGRDKTYKTSRLIIFDEAFSKMDGERIVRSIELLRKFNFQAVISAPSDKIAEIATLVDRNLCVIREGKHACVRSFDPKHAEDYGDG